MSLKNRRNAVFVARAISRRRQTVALKLHRALAMSAVLVVLLAALLFAPVFYWHDAGGGPLRQGSPPPYRPVYHSLGCVFLGIGTTYSPNLGGFDVGCAGPLVPL